MTNSKWDNMKALSLETQMLQQNGVTQIVFPVTLIIINIYNILYSTLSVLMWQEGGAQ